MSAPGSLRAVHGGVRFGVRVQPRASRSEVVGVHGDALKVRLLSPPVDGAANEALVDLLAASFAVRRGNVRIIAGHSSRSKIVEIEGVTAGDVDRLVAALDTAESTS
jgi:uncharacterized protein